ncbi:MAG: hypothetical protein IJ087_02305, partial [Eggerthellaceae bacterium]|nr:hypothetical protein [Eggerthellaceae bacterium]
IARDNPGVAFDIKPRYQPGNKGSTLHAVSEQLADFIADAPANLRLLEGRGVLEDIVAEYDAMIAMWSTAYLAAVAAGMPLLLLYGFDSVDVFDVRSRRVSDAYAQLESTGCLLHYSQLQGDIARLMKPVEGHCAEGSLYNFLEPCGDQVVSFMELACETLGKQGLRIVGSFCLTPGEYYSKFGELEFADAKAPSYASFAARMRAANDVLQEYVFQNRCMGCVLDMAPLLRCRDGFIAFADGEENDVEQAIEQMKGAMKRDFLAARTAFFESEEGFALARRDRVTQDYYFDWLFEIGDYGAIEHDETVPLLVPETREYYLARLALNRGALGAACGHLCKFLLLIGDNEVIQLQKDAKLARSLKPFANARFGLAFAKKLATGRGRKAFKTMLSRQSGSLLASVARFFRKPYG